MILIFKDTKLYHDLWETNEKRLQDSVVYNWNTYYKEHVEGYYIKSISKHNHPRILLNDESFDKIYLQYMVQDETAINDMVMMAFEASLGLDLVFLCTEDSAFLDAFLRIFTSRYGIVPREIKTEEDIPVVPEDCDGFSHSGLFYVKEDRARVSKILGEEIKDPAVNKIVNDRIDELEKVL